MAQTAFDFALQRFFRECRRLVLGRPLLAVFGLLLLVTLIFLAAPQLDLAVSGFFHDPLAGFSERRSVLLAFVRGTGNLAVKVVGIAVAVPLVVKLLAPESRLLVQPRTTLFALGTLALGPGLIVNGLLKSLWGRARPRDLIEFGGEHVFTPVWWVADQCGRNCSFVSGEAAAAVWLVIQAFVAPKPWRRPVAVATLALAAAVSFARIAVGGHFISDVLIAWLLTLLVIIVLDRLVLKGLPPAFDAGVEAGLTRAGRALRQWWVARSRQTTG